MSDRPIIFSAPMVRALLDGRKTMTRRLAWTPCRKGHDHIGGVNEMVPSLWQRVQPGDRLWVRENLKKRTEHPHKGEWEYAAGPSVISLHRDDPHVSTMIAWAHHQERDSIPSIHMPRWASRLTLIVTGAKVERLHAISEADKLAEGAEPGLTFEMIWKKLHGAGSWGSNPEVVAIAFIVRRTNIDAMRRAA